MRVSKLFIAIISLILVLTVSYWEWMQKTGPGPLHPSHAAVASLNGKTGCAVCHGAGNVIMSAACNDCHLEIKHQIDRKMGIHGSLGSAAMQACQICHTEHHGNIVKQVTDQSFHLAKVENPDRFDHSQFSSFALNGKHLEIKCEKCHALAESESLDKNQRRFLGLSQTCVTCHKDPHKNTFGPDCLSCHGQSKDFKVADGFLHAKDFPLVGGHGHSQCVDCHGATGNTSVAFLKLNPNQPPRTCVACHQSPHRQEMIATLARSTGKLESETCVQCHNRDEKSFLFPTAKMSAEQHAATGYTLDLPHAKLDCAVCHKEMGKRKALTKSTELATQFAALFPKHDETRCDECHQSPHSEKLISTISKSSQISQSETCIRCHGRQDKTFLTPAAKMSPEDHAATGFTLAIPHANVKCDQCHKEIGKRKPLTPSPELPLQFARFYPGREQNVCQACHADPHVGQFSKSASQGRCINCHAAERFVPSNFDIGEHNKTKFALDGAHRAVACVSCHKTIDKVQQFAATPTACNACHPDVHNKTFDLPGKPSQVDGKLDCARCHITTSFAKVDWSAKDHGDWTDYPLKGEHAKVTCISCHAPTIKPDELGRSFGIAQKSCISCHIDIHAGQFEKNNFTDCARCHSELSKFTSTIFDHQKDSRFKLDDVHIKLSCDSCHKAVTVEKDVKIVRYRPLGTKCEDCHSAGVAREKEQP